ncbi:MAG: aldo/keto reductase [Bifidobacteriaceae bacterium]|jgi:2,5-diketo-D-gluconate reductase A|nr:aldo/keto reductase [Bifidobacteriaceae bacterium]
MITPTAPAVEIAPGIKMPQVVFGTYQIGPAETASAVRAALEVGYRAIDTAAWYRNEAGVGQGVADSGLSREQVFITSKHAKTDHGRDATLRGFEATMRRLKLDALDLYLIHWPLAPLGLYVETWAALLELHDAGRIRSVGVSNFQVSHLEAIIAATGRTPAVNQIELHPGLAQPELRQFHAAHGITTECWAPLGKGKILGSPPLVRAALSHQVSSAQVALRWSVQRGQIVVPKSIHQDRMKQNLDVFSFSLSPEEMQAIDRMGDSTRVGPHPDLVGL